MPNSPSLSIVIPLFNEESVLPELYRRLVEVLREVPGDSHEIVFVDDGSRDGTWEFLEATRDLDDRVRVLRLSRNFGHQAALTAGLEHARGDVIVAMDGDLQDTPETIPRFLEKYHEGFDVVYAIRERRKEGWLLRSCYSAFYKLIGRLSEIPLPEASGDFALLSRRVVDAMKRSPERHRYLRGLRTWVGFRQTGVQVERAARHSGVSKYSIRKLFQLAFDGIFSFSVAPLRAATGCGVFAVLGSIAYVSYALIAKICFAQSLSGITCLISAITFLAGIQLIFLGVVGEYVGRIYQEVKHRPHYVIDGESSFDRPSSTGSTADEERSSIVVNDETTPVETAV